MSIRQERMQQTLSPGMSDKVINWDLDSLSLQDLSECLHDQLVVKGV